MSKVSTTQKGKTVSDAVSTLPKLLPRRHEESVFTQPTQRITQQPVKREYAAMYERVKGKSKQPKDPSAQRGEVLE